MHTKPNKKIIILLKYSVYTIQLLLLCLSGCSMVPSSSINPSDMVETEASSASIALAPIATSDEANPHANNILAIALDADGCVFNRNYIKGCKEANCSIIEKLYVLDAAKDNHIQKLLEHNQKLIAHITNQLSTKPYDKILFLIASWRQYANMDLMNAYRNKTALFFESMPILVDSIKQQHPSLSEKIVFDPYLITDTLEGDAPGTYYSKALNDYASPVDENNQYISSEKMNKEINHLPSQGKRIIVTKHLEHLQKKFPAATIDYIVYDDEPTLYEAYLKAYLERLADNSNPTDHFTVQVYVYNGDEPEPMLVADEDDDEASDEDGA